MKNNNFNLKSNIDQIDFFDESKLEALNELNTKIDETIYSITTLLKRNYNTNKVQKNDYDKIYNKLALIKAINQLIKDKPFSNKKNKNIDIIIN